MQVTVSVAVMQLEVSAAHMHVTVSAANMLVTIFIVIMQIGVSVAIMQVVFSAVHYAHGIYFLKVNNRSTRTRCGIYSELTIKTPERRQWLICLKLGYRCPISNFHYLY